MKMQKPKVRKLSRGTYRVTFSATQSYVVTIPVLWLAMGTPEVELREIAIACASEQLEHVG